MTEYTAGLEFQVRGPGGHPFQKITGLRDGGYVITWTTTGDIFAQRYDGAGTPIGGEVRVNTTTAGGQLYPAIAALADGGYVVTWKSVSENGNIGGIYAQRFDALGGAVGVETQVTSFDYLSSQNRPAVASLADGGYVVSWSADSGIHAQRYDVSGTAVGEAVQVNTLLHYGDVTPAITGLADGGFVVTWEAMEVEWGISAQRFNDSGAKVGGEVPVATYTTSSQAHSNVTALADGGYVVTWQSLGQDGSGFGIYSQRFNASGAAVGGEVRVNTHVNSDQTAPSVTSLADGGYVVTWSSHAGDGRGGGIYAQRFDASGTAVGGEVQVYVSNDHELAPSVASLANGSFVVTWTTQEPAGLNLFSSAYARQFTPVSFTLGDSGNNSLSGTAGADTINGEAGDDHVVGFSGNDILTGGQGSDRIFGGAGNDTLSAENMIAFDVGATVDYLYGGDGNDIIFSGFGDIVDGGNGFDTVGLSYVGASHGITGDTAILHRGEPLIAGGGTFRSIERFSDIAMTQFDDKMVIGDQKDSATVRGWNGNDHLIGQEMSITMYGGNGNDLLVGSTANDLLYGDDGSDILIGHLGMDLLWGGAGADRFIINQLDMLDRIIDFEHGVDKVDVSDIDADVFTAGNQAFTFIGTGNFTGAAGQLRIAFTSSATYMVEGDVNGDGKADLIIDLGFPSALTQGDFLL